MKIILTIIIILLLNLNAMAKIPDMDVFIGNVRVKVKDCNDISCILDLNSSSFLDNPAYRDWLDEWKKSNFNKEDAETIMSFINDVAASIHDDLSKCKEFEETFKEQISKIEYPIHVIFDLNWSRSPGTTTGGAIGLHGGFMYEIIKKLRDNKPLNPYEIETGGINLYVTLAHEYIHILANAMGTGIVSECVAHCLTKKCIDPNHNLKEMKCDDINDGNILIKCQDITDAKWRKFLEMTNDPRHVTKEGNCFCDIKWDESKECDEYYRTFSDDAIFYYKADHADDNVSFSSGGAAGNKLEVIEDFCEIGERGFASVSYYPSVMVYDKFYYGLANRMLDAVGNDDYTEDRRHDYFSNDHPVLVVPMGEMTGDRGSEIKKAAIERYVREGGTILVFAQQYGADVESLVPVPEGESLKAFGWREDQSCLKNSLYFENRHPVLSSSLSALVDGGVDGYFSVIPSSSTVLLRRKVNNEPALLYYPYGNGTVILTSLFTDWGLAHSQASSAELKLVRDLVTFAKNPQLPLFYFQSLNVKNTPQNLDIDFFI